MKSLFLLFLFSFFLFLNMGKILDITIPPSKTDLIVCLGGGNHLKRTEKAIELYEKNYLQKDSIIFTGVKSLNQNIYKSIDRKTNIIIVDSVKNTMEEVLYIKDYIRKNHLSSVIFITEAPHSRRIKIFWDIFGDDLTDVKFSVVASELKTWDSQSYYKNDFAKEYAYSEVVKLIYNLFVYGILDNIGLKEVFENNFEDEIKERKREILETFK
jgi:uncharacterized SAM-binding protein YcdF (DUF218 family)